MERNEQVILTEPLKKEDTFKNVKFEDLIDAINGNGKYQLRLNIIFICLSGVFIAMMIYSKMIALSVPDHWCRVPGREAANVTVEDWKNMTIPRDGNSYSKCRMYKSALEQNESIPCQHGWEYDDTWLSRTATSQEDWVCDRAIYASTALSMSIMLSVFIGMTVFYVGDRFGRRKQYILSMALTLIFRACTPFTSSIYPLFIIVSAVSAGASMPSTEAALAVGIELCGMKHRSANNFRLALCYALGTIFVALLAWLVRNWIYFLLIPAGLCCIPLLLHRYLPESPRWFVAKGRSEDALKVLQQVASVNGRILPDDTLDKLNYLSQQRTPNMGIKSIFKNKVLFRNTAILIWSRSAAGVVMVSLLLSDKNFGGNPFVPYIGQGVLHIPAISLSHYLGNQFGRRCSHSLVLLAASSIAFLNICSITAYSPQWMIAVGSLMIQFCIQASVSLTNLQSMEIHPTCVRQISMAMEYVTMSFTNGIGPYIAYLGSEVESRYMFGVLGTILLLSSVFISFLPESLNEKLPETLKDASLYGKNQKYWSLPKRKQCKTQVVNK